MSRLFLLLGLGVLGVAGWWLFRRRGQALQLTARAPSTTSTGLSTASTAATQVRGYVAQAASGVQDLASNIASTVMPTARISTIDDRLKPEFKKRLILLKKYMDSRGYPVWVFETFRTPERQQKLYAKGRTEPGSKVTWTLNSDHMIGEAGDLIDGRPHPDRTGQRVGWGSWEAQEKQAGRTPTPGDVLATQMASEFFAVLGQAATAVGLYRDVPNDLPHVALTPS